MNVHHPTSSGEYWHRPAISSIWAISASPTCSSDAQRWSYRIWLTSAVRKSLRAPNAMFILGRRTRVCSHTSCRVRVSLRRGWRCSVSTGRCGVCSSFMMFNGLLPVEISSTGLQDMCTRFSIWRLKHSGIPWSIDCWKNWGRWATVSTEFTQTRPRRSCQHIAGRSLTAGLYWSLRTRSPYIPAGHQPSIWTNPHAAMLSSRVCQEAQSCRMLDSDHFDPTALPSGTAGGWWRWSWPGFCTAKRRVNTPALPCQLPTCTLHGGASWPTRTFNIGMRKCGKREMEICHTTCMLRCEMCAMFQTWESLSSRRGQDKKLSCLEIMIGNNAQCKFSSMPPLPECVERH